MKCCEKNTSADTYSQESALASSSIPGWVVWILVALATFNVWPLFWYRYLPFMDHPSHLLKANIIANLHSSAFHYDNLFTLNALPAPNLLNDYLTALIGQITSIDMASHMMVAIAMIALPLSVWFYLREHRPGTEFWALFVIPMTWSRFLLYGNENFCLAVPLFFFLLGLLGNRYSSYSLPKTAAIFVLAMLIYFSHFMVFAIAGLALTLHFLYGKRDWRNLLAHAVPLFPGSILVMVWAVAKPPGGIQSLSLDLEEKLQALIEGVCPVPWESGLHSNLWLCFCCSLLLFMTVRLYWLLYVPSMRFLMLFIISCWLLAFCFQKWTFIYIPDQRMWWMSFMMGLVVLPKLSKKHAVPLGVFGVPFAIAASLSMAPLFSVAEEEISMFETEFSKFPKELRLIYFGDPVIPSHLHRVCEYYHLRHGGRNSIHLIGKEHSVDFKPGVFQPPASPEFGIYGYDATAWLPYLDNFDGALVIGGPSKANEAIISSLKNNGFAPFTTGQVTLLLRPASNNVPSHPSSGGS